MTSEERAALMRRLPDPFGEVFFANSQVTDRPTLFLHGDGAAVVCAWMHNRRDWQADAICAELLREVVRRGYDVDTGFESRFGASCDIYASDGDRVAHAGSSTYDDLSDLILAAVVEAFGEVGNA